MKSEGYEKSLWERVEDARKLGSFVFVCLALIIWIGARACFAFFQEAILHSLQDCLVSPNQRRRPRQARLTTIFGNKFELPE